MHLHALKSTLLGAPVLYSLVALALGASSNVDSSVSIGDGLLASANGVYNSSITPSDLPWNTYNYCNAPHVNGQHYTKPTNASHAKLVYLNAVIRHHKRTPDNLYPSENELNALPWDCTDFPQFSYGTNADTARVFHNTNSPSWHPFLSLFWNGTCDGGQLTRGGLDDAVKHGKDFWSVYHNKLGFLKKVDEEDILVRTSAATRTFQVAGGLLFGMDPNMAVKDFPVTTQPENIDSIPPSYPCPNADAIRNAYQSVPAWTDHLQQNNDLRVRLGEALGTLGMNAWESWYDHYFDTFTSRTCHNHPLPCNSTGTCVSNADAARVFALGDFEYNYIWNTAENSTTYSQLNFGVFMLELAHNLKLFQAGEETFKLRFYVGHDGSMIRLAALLGLGKNGALRWPALGSEIVLEVWETIDKNMFVRVMHEGTPVPNLEWTALHDFIKSIEAQIPDNIFQACVGS
ncbi:phosphoglycerate mutase-like protein [Epithele typhae]|uniref:phosphoglycerate mutase-like protein n=1 Tax=Epithele typhae TaxID=378194 RepID=UPI002007759D|nr:phosphoglycerate mutase-like protein [Epithele typhae]KAH9911777.1 phosphoglycerate mutase-like protein [Epithele typhae]